MPDRVDILGVPMDCVTMSSAVEAVDTLVQGDSPRAIIAVNPEKIMKARHDANLLHAIQGAGLLIPDGIGAVIAARLLWHKRLQRVPGSELMPAICDLAQRKGYTVYLYGAAPEVNRVAEARLRSLYPNLRIVGAQDGYVPESRMDEVIEAINNSGAQILFVALGSPRQELWMGKYLHRLQVKVCQGVGGTFDVLAGKVRRAPKLFCVLNLEWLYRLLSQPARLIRQTALPLFAMRVVREKLTVLRSS